MFFRDELLSWSWRRQPHSMNAMPPSIVELKKKVDGNVQEVMHRAHAVAPEPYPLDAGQMNLGSVQQTACDLVTAATSPERLCQMDPTWHPWF
eukprot:scaffold6247_cov416-Prasinococcus_capsulatus_cf.AAC.16